jgi:hypothetical protein
MIHLLVKSKIEYERQWISESSHNGLNVLWCEGDRAENDIKNSVACNPQANYTDRPAAACWRS